MKICKVENCGNKILCKDFCNMHYLRVRRNNSVDGVGSGNYKRDFSKKYIIDKNNCWIWQGFINPNGYGSNCAHRRVYKSIKGNIPEGMQLDHICKVRACVNPKHLEIVTPAENTRRSDVAKLTKEEVKNIREAHINGVTQKSLSYLFNIHQSAISRIVNYKRWKKGDEVLRQQ